MEQNHRADGPRRQRWRGFTPEGDQKRDHPGVDHHGPEGNDADGQQQGRVYDHRIGVGGLAVTVDDVDTGGLPGLAAVHALEVTQRAPNRPQGEPPPVVGAF